VFEELRPWPRISDRDRRCIEVAYDFLEAKNQPIPGRHLRFRAEANQERIHALMSPGRSLLQQPQQDTYAPTALALVYLADAKPRAAKQLATIEQLWSLAHERYGPDVTAVEIPDALKSTADVIPLQLYAKSVSLTVDNSRRLHPSEVNWETPTFLDAWRQAFHGVYASAPRPRTFVEPAFRQRITRLHAERFRCLHDLTIELAPLTVLVGANAVGKTTVLETLRWLSSVPTLASPGRVRAVRTRSATGPVRVAVDLALHYGGGNTVPAAYALALDTLGEGEVVDHEALTVRGRPLFDHQRGLVEIHDDVATREVFSSSASVALGTRDDLPPPASDVASALATTQQVERWGVISTHDAAAAIYGANALGRDPSAALVVAAGRHDADGVRDVLAQAVPDVTAVRVEDDGSAPARVIVEMDGEPFDVDALSGGTQQLLVLAALCVHPSPPHTILLEEPEGAVHPSAHAPMVHMLRTIAERSTVIVTSHSPAFVGRFDPDREVIALSRDEHGTHATSLADAVKSSSWLAGFGTTAEQFEHMVPARRKR
jgi:AAA domain, putative AbiEii toxin, Type IV TA system/AAA ATPase domain